MYNNKVIDIPLLKGTFPLELFLFELPLREEGGAGGPLFKGGGIGGGGIGGGGIELVG